MYALTRTLILCMRICSENGKYLIYKGRTKEM